MVLEGGPIWVSIRGDVCPLVVGIGGSVPTEMVSVTWESKLVASDPLLVPAL